MKVQQHQIAVYYNAAIKQSDFKQELISPKLFQYYYVMCHFGI